MSKATWVPQSDALIHIAQERLMLAYSKENLPTSWGIDTLAGVGRRGRRWRSQPCRRRKASEKVTQSISISILILCHQITLKIITSSYIFKAILGQHSKLTCMESKKKNMTRSDMEAPSGRHMACNESSVWMPLPPDEEACEEVDEAESLQSFSSLSPEIWQ